jgi:hypothetical protein
MNVLESVAKLRLLPHERRWLEQIFAAMLPGETVGLPSFDSGDHAEFFRIIEDAPGASFLPGLRVMLHALHALPLGYAHYRRPFFALPLEARRAFLAELAHENGYLSRQLVAALKILAGFAYFENPRVRECFDLRALTRAPMVQP